MDWGQYIWGTGYFVRIVGEITDKMIREWVES